MSWWDARTVRSDRDDIYEVEDDEKSWSEEDEGPSYSSDEYEGEGWSTVGREPNNVQDEYILDAPGSVRVANSLELSQELVEYSEDEEEDREPELVEREKMADDLLDMYMEKVVSDTTVAKDLEDIVEALFGGGTFMVNFIEYLTWLLVSCFTYYEGDPSGLCRSMVAVTNSFESVYDASGILPLHTFVFTLDYPMVPVDQEKLLKSYAGCYPNVDYVDHVLALFNYSSDETIYHILSRLTDVYVGDLTSERLADVFNLILTEVNNYSIRKVQLPYHRDFFIRKIKDLNMPSERVQSIDTVPLMQHNDLLQGLPLNRPSLNTGGLARVLYKTAARLRGLENGGEYSKAVSSDPERMKEYYDKLKPEDSFTFPAIEDVIACQLHYVDEVVHNEEVDIAREVVCSNMDYVSADAEKDLYRRLGPVNPQLSHFGSIDETNPCTMNGGCRMMTCWEFIVVDEDEEELGPHTSWFFHHCDSCSVEIEAMHKAVRLPLRNGGWSGCYCSWECVMRDTDDAVTLAACTNYRSEYDSFLLYDRLYPEVEPIRLEEGEIEDLWAELENALD